MTLDQQSILIPDRSKPGVKMAALAGDQGGSDKLTTFFCLDQNLVTKCFTVGTWSVRNLYASGKLEHLQNEVGNHDHDVIGLAEMWWTGVGDKIWWSGEPKRHEMGVGFLVKKNTTRSVLECNPISSRKI